MTECDEVADSLPAPTRRLTMEEARAEVRAWLDPDASMTILDNVAWSYMRRSQKELS